MVRHRRGRSRTLVYGRGHACCRRCSAAARSASPRSASRSAWPRGARATLQEFTPRDGARSRGAAVGAPKGAEKWRVLHPKCLHTGASHLPSGAEKILVKWLEREEAGGHLRACVLRARRRRGALGGLGRGARRGGVCLAGPQIDHLGHARARLRFSFSPPKQGRKRHAPSRGGGTAPGGRPRARSAAARPPRRRAPTGARAEVTKRARPTPRGNHEAGPSQQQPTHQIALPPTRPPTLRPGRAPGAPHARARPGPRRPAPPCAARRRMSVSGTGPVCRTRAQSVSDTESVSDTGGVCICRTRGSTHRKSAASCASRASRSAASTARAASARAASACPPRGSREWKERCL